ncbi:uncharacterized protein LOC112568111 isoform X2 [Pomacea canaliculata]|uniref:uncharacterized protein LOC112568111 isoform X2 n=1 Tax=Pomacea canaliculata TaxID=400727 RepID=UPI000D73804F|nr:uncharacterized protein LOC112568111 isoform X2 [Pomacea canaliculata]
MRLPYIFLLVNVLKIQEACSLLCSKGQIVDIVAGHQTPLTCPANEVQEWRLRLGIQNPSIIAKWKNNKFEVHNDFDGSFIIQNNSNQQSPLLVNAANNKNSDASILNGTLVCGNGDTSCGLNYVYPADGVTCTTVTSSWNVTVTCSISSAYSSRGIYKCQLIRRQQGLTDTNLDTVTMVTTPSKEPVAGTEVKESGSCQLHTTLPQHSGSYGYYVNITPGGQSHVAKYSQHYSEWFIVGKPHPLSSDNVIKVRNMHFDLMAYPMPHIMTILPLAGDADTSVHPVESVISCTADTHLPYKFTCNFTEKAPGYYHVVVTNYFGDGNFTLEVEDDDDTTDPNIHNKSESTTVLVAGVVAFVLLVIVIAIVIVVVKGKKSGKGQIPLRREEYEEPLDLGKRQIPLPKEEYEPAWDLGKRQIPLRKEEYEPAWDLGPLKINRLCANDNSEHLQQENYYEEIDDGVVVADKKKETQKDNKESTDSEEMYSTIV